MKKVLLIIGIILVVLSISSLLLGAVNLFGYYHVLDGSTELYHRLHNRGIVFLVGGIVLAVIGAACFLIRSKS